MKKVWLATIVVAASFAAGVAAAESPPTPAHTPAPDGAFESLSPGNQKIARAIFGSERTTAAGKPLSLDQIADMKQDGKGWGEIFHELKAQGLVTDKNLGQAVSRMNHSGTTASGGRASGQRTEITTASGRTMTVGGRGGTLGGRETLGGRKTAGGDRDTPGGSETRGGNERSGSTSAGSTTASDNSATMAAVSRGNGGGSAAAASSSAGHMGGGRAK